MPKRKAKRSQKLPWQDFSVETFQPFDGYEAMAYANTSPSSFNGFVRIHKYRITVERIDEPKEVLERRLRELWWECDNYHQMVPLEAAAAELGITLDHSDFGKHARK